MMICPLEGLSKQPIKLRSVVFPAPEAPTIAVNSPAEMFRFTPDKASTVLLRFMLYCLKTFFNSITDKTTPQSVIREKNLTLKCKRIFSE